MKQKAPYHPHLAIKRLTLLPGSELNFSPQAWSFLLVTSGVGYWLHARTNHDLQTGSALVLSETARGILRASQLGELQLHFFEVRPERLGGLITFGEQRLLQQLGAQDKFTARYFPPRSALAEKFKQLCEAASDTTFAARWNVLDVFAHAFREHLATQLGQSDQTLDARARLLKMLGELPASELLELEFTHLVNQMGCTPRHLSRIFREVVGMSFRQKQAQVRLSHAQELLATTESKVVEVALESGYQSLSLFNLMFKRRFGVSPAQFRDQVKKPRSRKDTESVLRILRA